VICRAVYDTEAEIPDAFKAEFRKGTDGKFYLKDDAVPGAAEVLNTGLAANRDRALQQKATAETKAADAEARAAEATRALEAVRAPGAVVLTPEQKKEWDKFAALGVPAKDVERIVKTDFPKLQQAETLRVRQTAWGKAAEQLAPFGVNLNLEALSDLMTHPQRGEGLEIESRPVEVDNGSGGKVTVDFPHIIERVPGAKEGEFEKKATPILDYASAKWPAWAVQALTSGQAASTGGAGDTGAGGGQAGGGGTNLLPLTTGTGTTGGGNQAGGGQTFGGLKLPTGQAGGGVKLPAMGAGGSTGGGGGNAGGLPANDALAAEYNTRRDGGRPSPLSRGSGQQQQPNGQQQQPGK
jgi:hypothetical protein